MFIRRVILVLAIFITMSAMGDKIHNAGSISTSAPHQQSSRRSSWSSRDVAYVAVFAALFIAMAFVAIPIGVAGVPIVMQNAIAIMAGMILGRRRGTAAIGLVLILGLIGLPVLAGGRSALSAFAGVSGGYVIGYLISAWVCGAIAEITPRRRPLQTVLFVIVSVLGIFVQYFFGAIWMVVIKGFSLKAALTSQLAFIGPDLVKMIVVGLIASGVAATFPHLLPEPR